MQSWLVTLKQPNTQTHMGVSRICTSKIVEIKEEGVVNQVLESITAIHHAMQKS